MPEYQPSHRLKSAAGGIESNCFTPQLLNGFEFRAHDERAGGARHVTGKDSERSSLDHCPDRISDYRPVIKFSADQCCECNGGIDADDLALKSVLSQETFPFCQVKRQILSVEFRNSDLDFICGVGPRMENQKSEQYDKNLIHRTPPFVTPANLYILDSIE